MNDNTPKPRSGKLSWIEWGVIAAIIVVLIMLLLPATQRGNSARTARRNVCKTNLKQIGLALLNYNDIYGGLPPAYTVDENGKPLHSWRALILPLLDQAALYEKIDFSKPWNDPANAEVYQTAVPAYRCPSDPSESKNTSYFALVGEDLCFHPTQSRKFEEIKDGLGKTLMVIESDTAHAVHWMDPVDPGAEIFLQMNAETKTRHTGGLNGLLGDGAVRFFSSKLPAETRQAIITIDGHETIADDAF